MLCGLQTELAERRTNKGTIRIVSQVRRTEGIHDSITSGSATLQRFFKKKHTGAPRSRTSQKRKHSKYDKKKTGDTKKKTQRQKNSKPRREENPDKYKIQETRLYVFKKTCILQDRHMQVLFLAASFIFVFISTFTPVFEESQRAQNEIKRYSREFYS